MRDCGEDSEIKSCSAGHENGWGSAAAERLKTERLPGTPKRIRHARQGSNAEESSAGQCIKSSTLPPSLSCITARADCYASDRLLREWDQAFWFSQRKFHWGDFIHFSELGSLCYEFDVSLESLGIKFRFAGWDLRLVYNTCPLVHLNSGL